MIQVASTNDRAWIIRKSCVVVSIIGDILNETVHDIGCLGNNVVDPSSSFTWSDSRKGTELVKSAMRRHSMWCHIRICFCQIVSWHYYMASPVIVCYAPSFAHSTGCDYLQYLCSHLRSKKRFFMSPLSSFHKLKQRSSSPDFPLKQTDSLLSTNHIHFLSLVGHTAE